jgi:hypothetical protein
VSADPEVVLIHSLVPARTSELWYRRRSPGSYHHDEFQCISNGVHERTLCGSMRERSVNSNAFRMVSMRERSVDASERSRFP